MYNTGNPLGSTAPKDFSDNAEITDRYVNDVVNETTLDRFGRSRLNIHGQQEKARRSFEQFQSSATNVIANLGFFPPVDYTTGLTVDSSNFTVTYNGVVYAAQPSSVPFTTGAWDDAQWYPIQNLLNQKNLLVFDTYAEASAAAATLPDGQVVVSDDDEIRGVVTSGAISQEQSIYKVSDYAKIRSYEGRGTRLRVIDPTGAHWWVRRGAAADNGGTVLVDASGRSWEREYSGSVDVRWFGAGSGADDTAPINAAISALPAGQKLIGLGLTYLVTGSLALKANMTLEDFVFDFSTAGNSVEGLVASGSMGTATAISSGTTAGSASVVVASDTGFAVDDYVYIASADMWDDWDDVVTMGEVHRIKSVSGTAITLYDPILYDMPTSPTLAKINVLPGLKLKNVTAIGSRSGAGGDQEGGRFSYTKGLILEDCSFTGFDDRSIRLNRTIGTRVRGGVYGEARKTGLSYGIALGNACYDVVIEGATFVDARHGVELGGDTDGVSRQVVVTGCNFLYMREAAVSTHTAADGTLVANNIIQCDPKLPLSGGGFFRSINWTFTGNQIYNPGSNYVMWRNNITGVSGKGLIANNIGKGCRATDLIFVRTNNGGTGTLGVDGLMITSNDLEGADIAGQNGITVLAATSDIRNVNIGNNTLRKIKRGVWLDDAGAFKIDGIIVSANIIDLGVGGSEGIFFDGLSGSADMVNIVAGFNLVKGGPTIGIRGVSEENIVVAGNNLRGSGTSVSLTAANNVSANNLA